MQKSIDKNDKDRHPLCHRACTLAKRPGRPVRYVGAHNFYYQPAGSKETAYLLSMKKYAATVYRFFEANGRLVCDEDTCMTHSITLGQLYTSRADHSNLFAEQTVPASACTDRVCVPVRAGRSKSCRRAAGSSACPPL